MVGKQAEFHYSVNMLAQQDYGVWTEGRTLEELRDNKRHLMDSTLVLIPVFERHKWIITKWPGIWQGSLHDVYIPFRLSWLFTKKGRRRRPSRALRMVGVPLVKVRYGDENRVELAEDGFDAVNIAALQGFSG